MDYAVILSGSIVLELDDGAEVELHAGDVLVQRGTIHNWINRGAEPCTIAFVLIDALPIASRQTMRRLKLHAQSLWRKRNDDRKSHVGHGARVCGSRRSAIGWRIRSQAQTPPNPISATQRVHSPEILPDRRVAFRLAGAQGQRSHAEWQLVRRSELADDARMPKAYGPRPSARCSPNSTTMRSSSMACGHSTRTMPRLERDSTRFSSLLMISGAAIRAMGFQGRPAWIDRADLALRHRSCTRASAVCTSICRRSYHTEPVAQVSRAIPAARRRRRRGLMDHAWAGPLSSSTTDRRGRGRADDRGHAERQSTTRLCRRDTHSARRHRANRSMRRRLTRAFCASCPADSPSLTQARSPESLVKDVIPFVEQTYRVHTTRRHRAIAGLSLGAAQTVVITANNPGLFAYIGVFSGGGSVGDPDVRGPGRRTGAEQGSSSTGPALATTTSRACGPLRCTSTSRRKVCRPPTSRSRALTRWPVWRDFLSDFAPRLFK